jgi:ribosomal protein L32E
MAALLLPAVMGARMKTSIAAACNCQQNLAFKKKSDILEKCTEKGERILNKF